MAVFKKICLILFIIFSISMIVGVLLNSQKVSKITIHLNEGGVEHKDKSLMGFGKANTAADYAVEIKVNNSWLNCGQYKNKKVGKGLEFKVNKLAPEFNVSSIRLLDIDKLETDLIESIPYDKDNLKGENYNFTVETKFDLNAGFEWFFNTALGRTILGAVAIVIIILIWMAFS